MAEGETERDYLPLTGSFSTWPQIEVRSPERPSGLPLESEGPKYLCCLHVLPRRLSRQLAQKPSSQESDFHTGLACWGRQRWVHLVSYRADPIAIFVVTEKCNEATASCVGFLGYFPCARTVLDPQGCLSGSHHSSGSKQYGLALSQTRQVTAGNCGHRCTVPRG